MARNARLVEPSTLFHITQRGNNHQEVFLSPSDRAVYLQLAHAHFADCALSLLAYCLMTNHVHWLARPTRPDSMAVFFRRVHGRYAQYLNTRCGLSGHLWQGRFFSCMVAPARLPLVLRYIEMNPVRAGIVTAPQIYPYSSAQQHLTGIFPEKTPLDRAFWHDFGGSPAWAELLAAGNLTEEESYQLRHCT